MIFLLPFCHLTVNFVSHETRSFCVLYESLTISLTFYGIGFAYFLHWWEYEFIVLDSCSKREGDASGITGGNIFLSFSTLSLWACWRTEDFFYSQQDMLLHFFPSPAEEISHFWHFDTSLTVREHGAPVYCWFLSLKQPSTAFIIPLIALNAAAFLVRLAKLWKLSRGYFVIKFTVMSSGGTGSVKSEITSGHFQRTS